MFDALLPEYSPHVQASAEAFLTAELATPTIPVSEAHANYLSHLLQVAARIAGQGPDEPHDEDHVIHVVSNAQA